MITIRYHETARQYANAAFQDTAIYVKFEASYIFSPQKHLGECDYSWIRCAQ